jgi:ketosteroid isomerase-like protein
VAAVIGFFASLRREDLSGLGELYAADARFKDPFNDVRGVAAIAALFEHMFDSLASPRFTVLQAIGGGRDVVLTWDFDFALRGRMMRIHGASHLHFDAAGRVVLHRDYWDAAEELYAKLPLLGALMRWLQRRLAAPRPERRH